MHGGRGRPGTRVAEMSKYEAEYSAYVGNLSCTVPVADLEELVYELFLQVLVRIL